MAEFHVGEIAIYVRPDSKFYGLEVTITGPAEIVADRCTEIGRAHV